MPFMSKGSFSPEDLDQIDAYILACRTLGLDPSHQYEQKQIAAEFKKLDDLVNQKFKEPLNKADRAFMENRENRNAYCIKALERYSEFVNELNDHLNDKYGIDLKNETKDDTYHFSEKLKQARDDAKKLDDKDPKVGKLHSLFLMAETRVNFKETAELYNKPIFGRKL